MAGDHIITELDGNRIKLTNLQKLLYPYAGNIKAEVIQYYKEVSPFILKYIGNRPLTLIRFPDGIEGTKFYAKNKPKWTPDWIDSARISDDGNDYLLANKTSDMVWLANLAALEIHPMQIKSPKFIRPDHFIFDLDPSPGFGFEKLKEVAFELRSFLEKLGYHPFVKLSGSKGIHIYVPIIAAYEHDVFIESIRNAARAFVAKFPKMCTLRVNKERRIGKVLIDIYRNHRSNSCIAPYSLRARKYAPVSMPVTWVELESIKSSQYFKLNDALVRLKTVGDVWGQFFDHAVGLHDQVQNEVVPVSNSDSSLHEYRRKRDFASTREPASEIILGSNDQFVVQLHDASNLHFDLRLEHDGVLLCWAIPKALPQSNGEKRLAIRTEDHPVKYLDFEGKIPKNEYGGGEMWIFDRGRYQMHKFEKKKMQFSLRGRYFKGKFNLFNTRENQWLISRESGPDVHYEVSKLKPMLAGTKSNVPKGDNYAFEVKWDGLRALLHLQNGEISIKSRSGSNLTKQFPELQNDIPIDAQEAILDGEIVVLNESGVSDFSRVISRLHSKGKSNIDKQMKVNKVVFYAYDLLYLDGRVVYNETFEKRRAWLDVILKKGQTYRISEIFDDGEALFKAGKAMGLEGIMAKQRMGKYFPGERNENWLKIKYRENIVAYIIGFTEGSGDRSPYFGSLHLAKKEETKWNYIGRVGSGFNSDKLKQLATEFDKIPKSIKLIDEAVEEERKTKWIQPVLRCEVQFASWTNSRTLREPVFLRLIKE